MNVKTNHTQKALSGSLWMISSNGGRQLLLVIMSIVLARILLPDDFAAVALVMAVLAVIEVISQMGMSVALIQKQNITNSMIDSVFSITLVLFLFGSLTLFLISNPISVYFELPLLSPLIKLTAITVIVNGFISFYRSLLLRDMRYQVISITEFFSFIVYGVIAVLIGLRGYGAYSIIWGHIGAAVSTLLIFIILRPYIPESLGTIRHMVDMMKFGLWVSLGRLLDTASGQFDRFLIGKVLSAQALGGYYLAQRMTTTIPVLITGAVDQVLLPIYSNAKNDPQIIERGYWKGLRYSAILVVPVCLLIALYARPLIWVFLGERWLFIVPVVRILSLFGAIHGLGGGIFASVVYASGVPQLNPVISGFRIIFLPICVLVGSRWDIEGVAWGLVCFGLAGRLFNQWLLTYYLSYDFIRFLKMIALPVVANFCMVIVGIFLQSFISLTSLISVLTLTIGCCITTLFIYILICRYTMNEEYQFIIRNFQKTVGIKRLYNGC
ncbi:MAG TPA: lipopolysaccharide biosynthesis protein [Syntrophorhabdus sp.]|nr:lipopolysaccharide biosynthesis protein [Syntrophorhabdus sp.]